MKYKASSRCDTREEDKTAKTPDVALFLPPFVKDERGVGYHQDANEHPPVLEQDAEERVSMTNEPVVIDKFIHKELLMDRNRVRCAKKVAREGAGTSSSCSDTCS